MALIAGNRRRRVSVECGGALGAHSNVTPSSRFNQGETVGTSVIMAARSFQEPVLS